MESWKLAAVTGVLAALGVSHGQEPTIDTALAYPSSAKNDLATFGGQGQNVVASLASHPEFAEEKYDRKVTASFRGSSLQDVLRWLTSQGVSFVADESKLPKDKKITLNVVDRPLKEVLQALATAMDGHWESEGGMLVWRSGRTAEFRFDSGRVFAPAKPPMPPKVSGPGSKGARLFTERDIEMFQFDTDKMIKGWKEIEVPDGNGGKQKVRVPEIDEKVIEEFAKRQEKWAKEFSERMEKDFGKDGEKLRFLKERKMLPPEPGLRITPGDPGKISKSLSDSQKKTLKERGYLKIDELTKEQQSMLGLKEVGKDATISIVINIDGEKIEIRSK